MDYPKSVPNVGLVGGHFVDEDTVNGVVGSLIPSSWGNSVTEEILNVIRGANIVPAEGSVDQLITALRAIIRTDANRTPVGLSRNGKMSVPVASATGTYTADELVVKTALGGTSWLLSNFNKVINLAVPGAGGMDVLPAPASGFVAIYAIYNPTTGTSALLATNATNAKAPEIYSGAAMPAGYTASALLTVVPTNSSSQFGVFFAVGRKVNIPLQQVYYATSAVAALVFKAGAVPINAVECSGEMTVSSTATGNVGMTIAPSSGANYVAQQNATLTYSGAGGITSNFAGVTFVDAQSLYMSSYSNAGSPTFIIYIGSYLL